MLTRAGRELAFIFRFTFPLCALTVISLMPSSPPTCLFSRPDTKSLMIPERPCSHASRERMRSLGRQSQSAEGEGEGLHARIEKLDLELSIGKGFRLANQLV